jgi:hypothetical protein
MTTEISREPVATFNGPLLAQFVEAAHDAYTERMAICLEGSDIGEDDARQIAEAEIGGAFVRTFLLARLRP